MNRYFRNTALAGAVLAASIAFTGPSFASSDEAAPFGDTYLGKSITEVHETLVGLGYEVRGMEMEDGFIEGYAVKDGKRYELYIDPKTGKFAKSK